MLRGQVPPSRIEKPRWSLFDDSRRSKAWSSRRVSVRPEREVWGRWPLVIFDSPRLDTLEGKRIGLWSNSKINTAELLDEVESILCDRYRIAGTQRGTYSAARVMRAGEWGDIEGCDAVILTHGD